MSMSQCVVKEWKMVNFELGKTNVKVKSSIQPTYGEGLLGSNLSQP